VYLLWSHRLAETGVKYCKHNIPGNWLIGAQLGVCALVITHEHKKKNTFIYKWIKLSHLADLRQRMQHSEKIKLASWVRLDEVRYNANFSVAPTSPRQAGQRTHTLVGSTTRSGALEPMKVDPSLSKFGQPIQASVGVNRRSAISDRSNGKSRQRRVSRIFFFRMGPTCTPPAKPTEGRFRVSYGSIRENI